MENNGTVKLELQPFPSHFSTVVTKIVFSPEQEQHSLKVVCMATDQRNLCSCWDLFLPCSIFHHCAWLIHGPCMSKGCHQTEISLPRFLSFLLQLEVVGWSTNQKAELLWLWAWCVWLALSITLLGQLQEVLHCYRNVSLLPWKYKRGYGQGNKHRYSESNRLLTNNKSWRASKWRVWLTETACIPLLTLEDIDLLEK